MPKLSSVRIMRAACLVTSLPEPIATPMSACLSAAASLTASPVMATMRPCSCISRARRSLSSGVTRPKTWSSGSRRATSSSDSAWSSLPLIAPGPSPRRLTDGVGGDGVVAGDHADVDAGAEGDVHGVLGLGAQRVDDADHPDEVEVMRHRHRVGGHRLRVRRRSTNRAAKARTRRPCSPIRALAASMSARASAIGTCTPLSGPPERAQRARTTSGPPLTNSMTRSRPSTWTRWKVAMNL